MSKLSIIPYFKVTYNKRVCHYPTTLAVLWGNTNRIRSANPFWVSAQTVAFWHQPQVFETLLHWNLDYFSSPIHWALHRITAPQSTLGLSSMVYPPEKYNHQIDEDTWMPFLQGRRSFQFYRSMPCHLRSTQKSKYRVQSTALIGNILFARTKTFL